MKSKSLLFVVFVLISLFMCEAFSQGKGTQVNFGKNRVQFKDFDWFYYRSYNFDTYYYRGGKELAQTAGKLAELNLKSVEAILDYRLEDRIQIVMYNKLSDLKQSNIGLEEEFYSTGGKTQIVDNKIFVHFTGDLYELEQSIRESLANVLLNEMMYGGSVQQMVQNSALLNLPNWYLSGLVSYAAVEWSPEIDARVKDGILSGRYKNFNRLYGKDAALAGHSLWKYIADSYGVSSISNVLYMTRINRNVESGFLYIIGVNLPELYEEWITHYEAIYQGQNVSRTPPSNETLYIPKRKKKKLYYSEFKISPDGRQLAWVTNDLGRFKVWVHDFSDDKTRVVIRKGYRTLKQVDYKGQLLSWHPNSNILGLVWEDRSEPTLSLIQLGDNKVTDIPMYKFQHIIDFEYGKSGKEIVLSAINKGQSDIYVFNLSSRQDYQITNDFYDDKNPIFIQDDSRVIFSSNRPDESLEEREFDGKLRTKPDFNLFMFDYRIRDNKLTQLTNTPLSNELQAQPYDNERIAYLSDENGIQNRNMAVFQTIVDYTIDTTFNGFDTTLVFFKDTAITYPITNYNTSIIEHNIQEKAKIYTEVFYINGQYQFHKSPINSFADDATTRVQTNLKNEELEDYQRFLVRKKKEKEKAEESSKPDSLNSLSDTTTSDPFFYVLEYPRKRDARKSTSGNTVANYTTIGKKTKKESTKNQDYSDELNELFKGSRSRPYGVLFSTKNITAQLGASNIGAPYERFTGSGPVYFNNGLNGLFTLASEDLMEDYKINGGLRLASDLTIPEYFVRFENLKKRLDKEFIFYKNGETNLDANSGGKSNSYEVRTNLKYPFDETQRVGFSVGFRRDDAFPLSTDIFTLIQPTTFDNWGSIMVDYVWDNTLKLGENLYYGTKAKVYAERYWNLRNSDDQITNIGFDFRHYQKIHRNLIVASRIAGAHSPSMRKTIYYLGGVDSWISPKFDNDTQINQDENYYFQALASNMRGFTQNARNGNSFMVINNEVRFPVFSYFFKKPIKSDFVKNFQIVPFFDLGSAWTGLDPFDEENKFNKQTIKSGPITVTIIEPQSPFVAGYGTGIRSRLLGYFIRLDYAWGIENGFILDPRFYFSLSLDF